MESRKIVLKNLFREDIEITRREWTGGQIETVALTCPWDFPGKYTEVGCHFLLQVIFPTQASNP